jgi:hypothetical protein
MSIPSLLILFSLITPFAFSYTVITTSGKKIQGTLINDQEATILIKDTTGVLISFKKQNLDLEAMRIVNTPRNQIPRDVDIPAAENPGKIPAVQQGKPKPSAKKTEPTIAQIAEETRKQRKGDSRTLSLEDLKQTPRLSIFGSESNEVSENQHVAEKETEGRWESRILVLKKEVSRLRERKIAAEASCDQAKRKQYLARTTPKEKPADLLSTYKESAQCRKLEEIDAQLSDVEQRLEDLREEARRAGVSWQILE